MIHNRSDDSDNDLIEKKSAITINGFWPGSSLLSDISGIKRLDRINDYDKESDVIVPKHEILNRIEELNKKDHEEFFTLK